MGGRPGHSLTRAHDARIPRGPRGYQRGCGHVALGQPGLGALTARAAQPHRDRPAPGCRCVVGPFSRSAAQLPAHHAGGAQVPRVIQDAAPHPVQGDLHAAITAALSVPQPQGVEETWGGRTYR